MGSSIMMDLALRLTADVAELKRNLGETNNDVKRWEKETKNQIKSVKKGFETIAGVFAAGGAVYVGFQTFKKVLESSQLTGDQLEIKLGGLKEAGITAAQNLASLDFSVSLRDAIKAGEEYAAVIDDLKDRQRSASVVSAEDALKLSKLNGQLRTAKTDAERKKILAEINEITKSEFETNLKIASEALTGQIDKLRTKYSIEKAEACSILDYIKNYKNYTREQQDALTEAQEQYKLVQQFPTYAEYMAKGYGDQKAYAKEINAEQSKLNDLINALPDGLKSYVKLWRPLTDLTDEQRDDIAKIYENWYNADAAFQRYQNRADKVESKISSIATKSREALDAMQLWNEQIHVNQDNSSYTQKYNHLTGIKPSTNNVDLSGIITDLNNAENATNATNDAVSNLTNTFQSLGDVIGGTSGSMVAWIATTVGNIPKIIMQYNALKAASIAQAKASQGEAISGAVASGSELVFPYNLAAIAMGVSAVMAALASMPKLANGGLAYGNSIVNVGEYAGASTNPEVIAPLNRLQSMMGGGSVQVMITSKTRGDDLVYLYDKRVRTLSKY